MSAIIEQSTKQLSALNRKKVDVDVRPTSVHELVYYIPKSITSNSINTDFESLLIAATNLNSFVEQHFALKYNKLCFDPEIDDLSSFITQLLEIVYSEGCVVSLSSYDTNYTEVLYDVPFEPMIYCVETKFLYTFPNKALKIGFSHLINQMTRSFPVNVLQGCSNYLFCGHILEMSVEYLMSSYEEDTEEYKEEEKMAKLWAATYKRMGNKIAKYAEEDLNLLYEYQPRAAKHKKLKELLIEGFSLNFETVHRFALSESESDGCLSYTELFGIYYDAGSTYEDHFIEYLSALGNNHGLGHPCGYYRYQQGICTHFTDEQDYDMFIKVCDYLERLNTHLNNNYANDI